ncbi:MAG: alpha/beta hydrolase [Bacteroidales bacterium]|nr:alpha/beta hydrolase [Bacteroidales bacterium]MBR0500819.1 alpha/beta hydrolase [Bacteroidales bacterium]
MEFFTTAAGISVHVWDTRDEKHNDGPCIFLLHGYLETMYIFSELVEDLKDRYRFIVIDLPGHGLTDSAPADPTGKRVNSMEFGVRVVSGVMEKCGVSKVVLAGHSMGGYMTLQALRSIPEALEAAVLIHSHPFPDDPERAGDRAREKALIEAGKLHTLAGASIPKMYYEENLRSCDEKIRETVELCETHDPEGIISSIDGLMTRPDQQEIMKHPPVPLYLIHGDHDNFLPLERVASMKELFPEVHYLPIPGTGHNSFIESPEEFRKALEAVTRGNC